MLDVDCLEKVKEKHLSRRNRKSTITNLNELLSNLKNLQRSKAIRTLKLLEETYDEQKIKEIMNRNDLK